MAGIGSTPSLVVGIAAGAAASAALEPALEIPKQEAWQKAAYRLPDMDLIARLYVTGEVSRTDALDMASRLGFSADRFDAFAYLAQVTPSFSETLNLWRRFSLGDLPAGTFPDALVDHSLAHEGLDWDYAPYLKQLKTANLIGLGDIATAVVRGALPSPAYMPVPPPTTTTKVKRFPQVDIDPEKLAAALGFSPEQLQIMVARSGLSLAPIFAANAYFRGLIEQDDFELAIAEGDLRTEWAETLKDAAREIVTAEQGMEGVLRGWWDKPTGYALAARHGMSQADADRIYQIRRRPLSPATITKALARGGTFDTSNAPFDNPYVSSVHEADLGPEWYSLAEAMKYSYPSAFVVRSLLTDGTLSEAEGEDIFLKSGWEPSLAKKVATHYAGGTSTTTDPHVTKAQTRLWTTMQTSYISGEVQAPDLAPGFQALGIAAPEQNTIRSLWDTTRELERKQLTPTQLKKAVAGGVVNPATNAPWTHDDAVARLISMGYSANDAATFLAL